MIITKKAQDLKVGDVINPPAHERGWLKSKLTVIELKPANPDKRGPWLSIKTSYASPYGNGQKISEGVFNFRPETAVKVFAEGDSTKPDAPKPAAMTTDTARAPQLHRLAKARTMLFTARNAVEQAPSVWDIAANPIDASDAHAAENAMDSAAEFCDKAIKALDKIGREIDRLGYEGAIAEAVKAEVR